MQVFEVIIFILELSKKEKRDYFLMLYFRRTDWNSEHSWELLPYRPNKL